MSVTIDGPSIDDEHLRTLHTLLIERNWRVELGFTTTSEDLITHGHPVDPEAWWEDPLSYRGVKFNQVDDISPQLLSCSFEFKNGAMSGINLHLPGNEKGCMKHRTAEICISRSNNLFEKLTAALDTIEPKARALDVHDYLNCRFFGPCGESG